MLINPAEILDLISEVGHTLLLCDLSQTQPANVEYGVPAKRAIASRPVRGYVLPEKISILALVANAELKSGSYTAYVIATDMTREELTERSRIAFEGTYYPIEYLEGVHHRGVVMMHKLRLLRPQGAVAQPTAANW